MLNFEANDNKINISFHFSCEATSFLEITYSEIVVFFNDQVAFSFS